MKKKQNTLIRAYVNGNLGDDLFIRILCDRYPKQTFAIVGSKIFKKNFSDIDNLTYIIGDRLIWKLVKKVKNTLGNLLKIDSYKYYNPIISKTLKYSSSFTNNILISGSFFMEWTADKNYWNNYFKQETIYYSNKPIIIGVNIGPYQTKNYINRLKNMLENVSYISVRDKISQEILFPMTNVNYAPDIVFCLEKTNNDIVKEKSITFVVPNRKSATKEYIDKMVRIIMSSAKSGYYINIVSFCKSEGDELVLQEINELLENTETKINNYFYRGTNLNEILKALRISEIVIAARYHAMILGWLFENNVIPICYSKKMVNVIQDIDPNTCYYEISNVNAMPEHIDELLELSALPNLKEICEKAQGHFAFLDKQFLTLNDE